MNNRATLNTLIQAPTATPTATVTATASSTTTATPTPTVTPTATPTRLPGDFNGDGFVDIRDYGVWRQNFGQTNCGNPADADGNCLVDIRDYGIWRQHFGEGTPPDRRGGGPLPAGDVTRAEQVAAVDADASDGSWIFLRTEGPARAVPVIP